MQTIGKYEVQRLLGQGAMGRVLLAEDATLGRRVAIKILSGAPEATHERFLREARVVASLTHPNIVVVHEFGIHEGHPYLVMEYLEGRDLEDWLAEAHALREKLEATRAVCEAVSFAHSRGVLHRDIKPSNIYVSSPRGAKLIDFGIARAGESQQTSTGQIVGTPQYMAPEILAEAAYSKKTDVYAAALVFYRIFAGANPFEAASLPACLNKVLTIEPPPLDPRAAGISSELARAIMACLAKDPDARPDSLAAIEAEVENGLLGLRTHGPRETRTETEATQVLDPARAATAARPTAKRWSAWMPWAGAGAVVVIGLLSWLGRSPVVAPEGLVGSKRPRGVARPAAVEPAPPPAAEIRMREPRADEATPGRSQGPIPAKAPASRGSPPPEPSATSDDGPSEMKPSAPVSTMPAETAPPPSDAERAAPAPSPPIEAKVAAPATPPVASPRIVRIEPSSLRRGRTANVVVIGTGFPEAMAATLARGGETSAAVTVARMRRLDDSRIELSIEVAADAPLGSYTLVLATPEGARTNRVMLEVEL